MSIYLHENRFAFPLAFYALNLSEFDMSEHRHNRCEIMHVVDGECEVTIDGEVHKLKSRQLVFIDQNVPHSLHIVRDTPCTLLNLEFICSPNVGGTDLHVVAQNSKDFTKFLENHERFLKLNDSGKLSYALKDLISELEKRESDNQYLLDILFIRMLIELTKCTSDDSRFTGMLYLKKAKRYISDNLCEDINVEIVSKNVGINHSYLQTLFSHNLGCGIMTYINNLRMDKASFLLKNSTMKITDIAFRVGFNSRQHFGYIFEKRFNMSPKQYRKLNGQNLDTDTGISQWLLCDDGDYKKHDIAKTSSSHIV